MIEYMPGLSVVPRGSEEIRMGALYPRYRNPSIINICMPNAANILAGGIARSRIGGSWGTVPLCSVSPDLFDAPNYYNTHTINSIMTAIQPTLRFQWKKSKYHLLAPITLQLLFFLHNRRNLMKYSTILTVPSVAVLILNTALWLKLVKYHNVKYRTIGTQTQSTNISVQNHHSDLYRVRSV